MGPGDASENVGLRLRLLDPVRGTPIQEWSLVGRERVTIGRLADSDVALADPRVSRLHVELILNRGEWLVRSHGRHGTWIEGSEIATEAALADKTVLRLGPDGPSFEVLLGEASAAAGASDRTSAVTIDINSAS